ncbi:MAG TPA: DUF507 family protein [Candidatus Dormibacteraeota bacterium]|nr:DUF507 family protein [Candidatus Dormibacteraeota bacterium]
MHIPEAAINRLADEVVQDLVHAGFIKPKVGEKQLVARVARLLVENLRAEQEIEEEAERAAQKLGRQALGMDQRELMKGLKIRIAKERGFIL